MKGFNFGWLTTPATKTCRCHPKKQKSLLGDPGRWGPRIKLDLAYRRGFWLSAGASAWKRFDAAVVKAGKSRGFTAFSIVFPFWMGALIADVLWRGLWGFMAWLAGASILLIVSTYRRDRQRLKLIEVQSTVIDVLHRNNDDLREIALAGVAVLTAVEHGLKPNVEPLGRFLDAYIERKKAEAEKTGT